MVVITFQQIVELNRVLEPLGCKMHLSDACGGQSMQLEVFAGGSPAETVLAAVEEYFAGQGIRLKRLRDGLSYRAVE